MQQKKIIELSEKLELSENAFDAIQDLEYLFLDMQETIGYAVSIARSLTDNLVPTRDMDFDKNSPEKGNDSNANNEF